MSEQFLSPELLAEVGIDKDLIPDDTKLKTVSQLAQQMQVLERRIALASAEVERLTREHKVLAETTLPRAMVDAGTLEFTLLDGSKVQVSDGMSISVPKKNMGQVCAWLREHNHADIIKHEIVIPIPKGKGSEDKVANVEKHLVEQHLEYSKEENVHSGTLKALLKEQREKGAEINLSMFGAYEWQVAELIPPKEKSTKK